jgi:hypothetical protein
MTNEELAALVVDHNNAIYGEWDGSKRKERIPGINERLRRLELGMLVVGVLVSLRFLGVPTEQLFPALLHLFHLA